MYHNVIVKILLPLIVGCKKNTQHKQNKYREIMH